jgi:ABC-type cobalamin/Fe3+-siderophores transport system ATPase subunit
MVLHDINQASLYSDHIVALADGKVVCQGAAEEVSLQKILRPSSISARPSSRTKRQKNPSSSGMN